MAIRGSCLCGDVAFEVNGTSDVMGHCHCSMCRKSHGTGFETAIGVDAKNIRWIRGSEGVQRFESSPGNFRAFCARCGSEVPNPTATGQTFVSAGLLDDDPELRPGAHIFVASKAPWHEIADALPRFEGFPPGMGEPAAFSRPSEVAPGKVRGSCLCGGVAYEIDAPISGPIINCHCSRCRKGRAAAHASNLFVDPARFRWLRGEDQLSSYKVPDAERFTQVFCRTCGSPVPRMHAGGTRPVAIPAGSLDDDPGIREEMHIFVGSKAPWYEIADALPQHETYPPGTYPPAATQSRA
ncbi:MAG: hypothetical protein QOD06_1556 [Candidatus Binatota bacterium]|jgi:hypothetical protein|nr:hypothetical protein [Candidatus Binatota bacterium]